MTDQNRILLVWNQSFLQLHHFQQRLPQAGLKTGRYYGLKIAAATGHGPPAAPDEPRRGSDYFLPQPGSVPVFTTWLWAPAVGTELFWPLPPASRVTTPQRCLPSPLAKAPDPLAAGHQTRFWGAIHYPRFNQPTLRVAESQASCAPNTVP